jgi:hypothetical protein
MKVFSYTVDSADVITSVSNSWLDFAVSNGALDMRRDNVLGTKLWDWIADAETRLLYGHVFEKVRRIGCDITVPFRCDSPVLRRFMKLQVKPADDRGLTLLTEIIREESRPPQALLNQSPETSEEFVRMCGWCKLVHCPESDEWLEVEEAVEALGLFEQEILPSITHTICTACSEVMMRSIAE